jgi:hypothetical protein
MIYLYDTTEQINMEEFRIASGHSHALINAFPVPPIPALSPPQRDRKKSRSENA